MDERGMPVEFEHLFEHQEWVRALAVRLSTEASAAEDVVQETWLEVLRSRGAPESPRAWLGGIVRNLARNARRRDGSRSERERRAAQPEHLPSAADLLERAELQRRVLAAVASLDEPSRVVVLLRYAEGLDGETVAARLGVPGSTVRNRLARALERLRSKLDREYGDRSHWAVLLAPPLGDATARALTVGGGAVKMQFALAAGLVVLATAAWWPRPEGSEGTAAPLAASVDPGLGGAAEGVQPPAVVAEASADPASRSIAARVDRVILSGRVIGPIDGDAQGAAVRITGSDGIVRPVAIGDGGAYSVFGVPPGAVRASVRLRGFVPFREEFVVGDQNERAHRDFVLEHAFVLPVRFTDRAGGPLDLPREIATLLAAVATRDRPTVVLGEAGRRPGVYGVGQWFPRDGLDLDREHSTKAAGVLEIREPGRVWISAVLRERVLDARPVRGDETELVFELDPAEVMGSLASVVARVVDGRTGNGIPGASIELGFRDATGAPSLADADGRVAMEQVVPGLRRVTVRASGYADLQFQTRVPAVEQTDLGLIELLPTARLRGRTLDAEGHGIAAQVDVISARILDKPRALERFVYRTAAADGVFEANGIESGRVLVVARDRDRAPTVRLVDAGAESADGVELRLVAGTPIELRPRAGIGAGVFLDVRDASGLPVYCASIYSDDPLETRLAPGEYTLRAIRGEEVMSTQTLSVGREKLAVEVLAP